MANVIQIKRSTTSSASGIALAAGELAFGSDKKLFIGDPFGGDNIAIGGTGSFVDVSTDQSVGGVKTFSASPVVPNGAAGTEAINAGDVDTKLTAKINLTVPAASGNLAGLDALGQTTDSGIAGATVITTGSSINDLNDVDTTDIADGKVLVASGGSWVIGDAEDPTTIQNGTNKVVANVSDVTITTDSNLNVNTGPGGSLVLNDGGSDGSISATGTLTLTGSGTLQLTGGTTKIGAVTYPSNAGTAGQLVVLTANDTIGYGNATTGVISDFPAYTGADDGKYLSVSAGGTTTEFVQIQGSEVAFSGTEADVDAAIVAVRAEAAAAQDKADDAIPLTQKGANDGVATLDGTGQIPESQLPGSVLGAVAYQGTWEADTAAPAPAGRPVRQGDYWIVGKAGSTSLDGIAEWEIGDWAIHNGTSWGKVDNSEPDITAGAVSYAGGTNYNTGGGVTVESALDTLDTAIGNNDTEISTLDGRVTTNEGDILGLDGRLGTAETNITELTNDTTGDSAAETSYNGAGTNYLTAQTDVQGAVNTLDARAKTNSDAAATADGKAVTADGKAVAAQSDATQALSDAASAATAVGTSYNAGANVKLTSGTVQGALDQAETAIVANENAASGALTSANNYTDSRETAITSAYEAADSQIRLDFAAEDTDIRSEFAAADGVLRTDFEAADSVIIGDTTITAESNNDIAGLDTRLTAAESSIDNLTGSTAGLSAVTTTYSDQGTNYLGAVETSNVRVALEVLDTNLFRVDGVAGTAVQTINTPVGGDETGTTITLTKADFGLENVSNTAPADLPVSDATTTELNKKIDKISGTNDNFVMIGSNGAIIVDSNYNYGSFATAAQGDLADTAVQPADVANFTLDGGTF